MVSDVLVSSISDCELRLKVIKSVAYAIFVHAAIKNKMISFKEVKRNSESIFVIIDEDDAWIYKLISLELE